MTVKLIATTLLAAAIALARSSSRSFPVIAAICSGGQRNFTRGRQTKHHSAPPLTSLRRGLQRNRPRSSARNPRSGPWLPASPRASANTTAGSEWPR